MLIIIQKVFAIFVYIGVGFVLNKLRILPIEANKYLISMMMNVTTPCLLISSIVGEELREGMMFDTVAVFLITLIIFIVTAVLSMPVSKRVSESGDPFDANVLAVGMTSCNSGFMGFPISKSVFGGEVFYYVVIQNISLNLYLFIISIIQLHHGEERQSEGLTLKRMLKPFANAVTIVTVISVILLFAGIKIPDYPMEIISGIGDITIPTSMMVVGVQLGDSDFRRLVASRELLLTSLIRLIIFPALILLVMLPLPFSGAIKLAVVLSFTFPSAVMGVALAATEGKNANLMAEAVASTTLFSMITLPVWLIILSQLFL